MAASSFVYITEQDVQQRLTMPAVIAAVEQAFRALAEGCASNVPRFRVKGQGIMLHSMTASADYLGLIGWKQYTTTARSAVFHVGVYDQQSGALKALIEANRLGQLRTGATTGVAARFLTADTSQRVALIGSGFQAETQLEALAAVRPLDEVRVYSRHVNRREQFAAIWSEKLQVPIRPASSAEDAVREATIIITATSSRQPVIEQRWLAGEQFLAAVGSNWPEKSELEIETVRNAHQIVCDSIAACSREAGELIAADAAGAFRWDKAAELADIVAARQPRLAAGLTIFKSVGMAVEDLAAAALLLS